MHTIIILILICYHSFKYCIWVIHKTCRIKDVQYAYIYMYIRFLTTKPLFSFYYSQQLQYMLNFFVCMILFLQSVFFFLFTKIYRTVLRTFDLMALFFKFLHIHYLNIVEIYFYTVKLYFSGCIDWTILSEC